jgi:hypothetical protein
MCLEGVKDGRTPVSGSEVPPGLIRAWRPSTGTVGLGAVESVSWGEMACRGPGLDTGSVPADPKISRKEDPIPAPQSPPAEFGRVILSLPSRRD